MEWIKSLILSFFTIFSNAEIAFFESKLIETFTSMNQVHYVYPEIEQKTILSRPPNTILDLISYQTGKKYFCLTYRTPYMEIMGELILWNGKCEQKDTEIAKLENIKELEIKYADKKLSLNIGSVHKIEIQGGKRLYFDGFSPEARESLGLNPDDKYRDGNMTFCHRVNENCQEIVSNQCDRCAFGWYEVVDYACPGIGGSKICGPSSCGERGEPACVRGIQHGAPPLDTCSEGSTAGFCQKGLETMCDENKILICK